jgi:histidinol-phosphate aminotransferase
MKIENLLRENVKNMLPYSSARDEFTDSIQNQIFLDANENPFESGVNRYPDPYQKSLKLELSKLKNVPTNQLMFGNGSDEVLDLIFRAFCEPKVDNIITLPPTYGMYKVLANLNNVEEREVLLTKCFQPQVKEILEAADNHTKLLFLCSPNNPTGNSFSPEVVAVLLTNFKGLVVIDEAYIDFSSQKSWLERLHEFPNLIITQTLSKAFGLAGIRLGICYASPQIIAILNKIKPPYNINELTQQRALKRLLVIKKVQDEIDAIIEMRNKIVERLKTLAFVKKVYPTDANFILIEVDDATKRYQQLLNKGIVVRNRTNQPLCKNTLRITVGTKKENKVLCRLLNEL